LCLFCATFYPVILDRLKGLCYNEDTKREEIKIMFYVDCGIYYAEFTTYREAEIFCGERGISCEEIYEENEIS
jgi:hypothetical protein